MCYCTRYSSCLSEWEPTSRSWYEFTGVRIQMSSDVKSYMETTTKHQRRYKKRDSNDRFVLLYAVHQALCQSDFGIYTLSQATMRGGPEPTYDYRWIHKRRFWCSTETSSPTRFSCSPAAGQAGCVKANDMIRKLFRHIKAVRRAWTRKWEDGGRRFMTTPTYIYSAGNR